MIKFVKTRYKDNENPNKLFRKQPTLTHASSSSLK